MSNIIDSFGDPDRNPASRTATNLPHALLVVAPLFYLTRLAADLFPAAVPLWLAIGSLWGMGVPTSIAVFHQEQARICVRCMREVPANAQERATQLRLLLRLTHWGTGRYLAIWGSLFLLGAGATSVGGPGWSWVLIPCDTVFFASAMGAWVHHRLRPWCPFCRRWGDGDGPRERVPNPDPAGVKSS